MSSISSSTVSGVSPVSVIQSLRGRGIFLTGATGFVGKVIVEKILRSIPDIKALYILVRPRKGSTADERLQAEIVDSPIFNRLRSEQGSNFKNIISKLVAVPGELTQHEIGFSPSSLALLIENVSVIIHCAAIVDFNERIDRAVELNVMGSLRVLDLAKRCKSLVALIHVSTCYVNSNRRGWVDEKIYPLGFDPEEMLAKVKKMNESEMSKVSIGGLLGEWPNTYTFTKAMTETLLYQRRGNVPLCIVRPSIVGCSWSEPVPGWVDVISAAGAVYAAAGLGVLKFLPGRAENIADVVPVDYVVNSILLSIPALCARPEDFLIVHAATSSEKPMYWGNALFSVLRYYSLHPPPRRVAAPSFVFVQSPQALQIQFFLKYSIPSSLLNTNALLLGSVNSAAKSNAQQFSKLLFRVRVLIESFRHFTENEWQFNNRTTRALYALVNDDEKKLFNMELADLNWDTYNWNFQYGLMKYVFKEDLISIDSPLRNYTSLNEESWSPSLNTPFIQGAAEKLFYDATWARRTLSARPNYPAARPLINMKSIILSAPAVINAIKEESISGKVSIASVEARAHSIVDTMFGDTSMPVVSGLGYFFRKIWRRIYDAIKVENSGLAKCREAASKGPVIFLPTHRSYIDFLIVSYISMACHLPIPYIAAGEDFLGIAVVRWLFRHSGAFFIRRSFLGDALYNTIFSTYVQQLLLDGQSIEFFIEGTRSRSGKMLSPKVGLLSIITDAVLDKKINDVTLVPITIDYEKTMEADLYSDELLGEHKIKESLKSLLNSTSVLNVNFGDIYVNFGDPISLKQYVAESLLKTSNIPSQKSAPLVTVVKQGSAAAREAVKNADSHSAEPPKFFSQQPSDLPAQPRILEKFDPFSQSSHRRYLNRQLASQIVFNLADNTEALPTHVVASLLLMYRQGITRSQLCERALWVRKTVLERGGRIAGFETSKCEMVMDKAIKLLGGLVIQRRQHFYEPNISARVNYKNMLGLGHYRNKLLHLFFREGMFACAMYSLHERKISVATQSQSHYNNNFNAHEHHDMHVSKSALLSEVSFLHSLLCREFISSPSPNNHFTDLQSNLDQDQEDHIATLRSMVQRGIVVVRDENNKNSHLVDVNTSHNNISSTSDSIRVEVAATGETAFSFLCALFWPFIDSYYVSCMMLLSLQPQRIVEEGVLLQRTQWLATTLYHESMLSFYESCSLDTLRNAFQVLNAWGVINIETTVINPIANKNGGASANNSNSPAAGGKPPSQKIVVRVSLNPSYQSGPKLSEMIARISMLRKQPPVKRSSQNKNLIADIPILAKL